MLQVPALTVFLETVRNLLLPFLQSNENIKEMKHTNFSLLRKGVPQICHHEYIREFDVFENRCLKNEKIRRESCTLIQQKSIQEEGQTRPLV